MKIEHIAGQIRINAILHSVNLANFHLFEIILKSEYPGEILSVSDDGCTEIYINTDGERSVYLDEGNFGVTCVVFPFSSDEGWSVMTEGTRHIVRIVFRKPPISPE